eukprot:1436450-Amphidinium_carterae.1
MHLLFSRLLVLENQIKTAKQMAGNSDKKSYSQAYRTCTKLSTLSSNKMLLGNTLVFNWKNQLSKYDAGTKNEQ